MPRGIKQTFQYTLLSATKSTIRIIRLPKKKRGYVTDSRPGLTSVDLQSSTLATNNNVRMSVELVEVPLDGSPTFCAISYTWNGQIPSVAINCNGQILKVTQNCFDILCEAQDAGVVFIWIDAICIDQENILERNRQVGLMSQIYRSAIEVLIWLGKLEEIKDLVLLIHKSDREDNNKLLAFINGKHSLSNLEFPPHLCVL
jgi:hypothetical protein